MPAATSGKLPLALVRVMTLLYRDPLFRLHMTGAHPEHPRRLVAIEERIDASPLPARCTLPTWKPATIDQLARVHDPLYIDEIRKFAAAGGGRIEADTVLSPRSYDAAILASGAACNAVERVIAGEEKNAFLLHRPPGHHALPHDAMGFCLFNHVAVAAAHALDQLGLNRVLIVDWDVHHGNGTQDMFYTSDRVAFFSSHRWPFYPGTGAADETGTRDGLGFNKNLPLEFGIDPREFLAQFAGELQAFADRVKPELVLISAGFDAHRDDPIGSLSLEAEHFGELTRIVKQIAAVHAQGRVVSLLEGGYNPAKLAESVEAHLAELLAE